MPSFNQPHRRYNPLLNEWILVSPHRAMRPWQGKVESTGNAGRPKFDPKCYLCPGNQRASGAVTPKYQNTFVFENDFPALLHGEDGSEPQNECNGIIRSMPEKGLCRVICFSPRHDLTLAEMEVEAIRKVVDLWIDQYCDLRELDFISHVMIFENKGELMGCSNPHPHGQIWSTEHIPTLAGKKIDSQLAYCNSHGSSLLMDYLKWELQTKERVVAENDSFVALVPFWATWPFETMILPRREVTSTDALDESERSAWAAILKELTVRYDNLFETSFPYSMGITQKPTDGREYPGVVFHQSFYPPLLRSAVVRKFLVGYEMSGESQRDITPEQAAGRLRECGGEHYSRV